MGKKIIFIMICAIISSSIFWGKLPNFKSDPFGALTVSQNLIQNRTLNLYKIKKYWKLPGGGYKYQIYGAGDKSFYYSYPLGTPLISAPFVYIADALFGLNMLETQQELLMQEIICSLIVVGIFFTIYAISIRYFSFFFSLIIALFGIYGTAVGAAAGTGLWNLNYDMLFSGLTALLVFLWVKKDYLLRFKKIEISSFLIGFFMFLSFISRPTAAFLIFFILLFLLFANKNIFFKSSLTAGISLILYEAFLYVNTGSILNNKYRVHYFGLENFWQALAGFFLSPARGVIIFDPFLILTAFGLYFLFKNKRRFDSKIIYFILALIAAGVSLSIALLFWKDWWGGESYGPRIFTDGIYWYFLAAVIIFGEIKNRLKFKPASKKALTAAVLSSMAIGLFINVQGIYNKYAMEWNIFPNSDNYSREVLFDWRFPQFLMTKELLEEKYFVQGTELGLFKKQSIEISRNIPEIRKAAVNYFQKFRTFNNMYPRTLENIGFLDKSFGANPINASDENWTRNGYWIGEKGNSYAVGVYKINAAEAKNLYSRYIKKSRAIYFPYPKVFNPAKTKPYKLGFMLISFKRPPLRTEIKRLPFTINFAADGNEYGFINSGFCKPEIWGTWSCAKKESLSFSFKGAVRKPVYMKLKFITFASPVRKQILGFYFNGRMLAKKEYAGPGNNELTFDVSNAVRKRNTLTINIPDAVAPKSLGISPDARTLGIGLKNIEFFNKNKRR